MQYALTVKAVDAEGNDLTENGVLTSVDLYRGDTKVYTVTADKEGNPLYALPGQQLNVDIELRYASVKVTVTIAPWGEVNQETEM